MSLQYSLISSTAMEIYISLLEGEYMYFLTIQYIFLNTWYFITLKYKNLQYYGRKSIYDVVGWTGCT